MSSISWNKELQAEGGNPKKIIDICQNHSASFNEVNVATAWHSLAICLKRDKSKDNFLSDHAETLQALAGRTKELRDDYTKQNYATLMWSLGTLGFRDEELIGMLVEMVQQYTEMNAQEFSMTSSGAKALSISDRIFWDVVTYESSQIIDQFSPQGLSAITASFPDFTPVDRIEQIVEEAIDKMAKFKPDELLHFSLAIWKRKVVNEELFKDIIRRALVLFDELSTKEITGIAFALTRFPYITRFQRKALEKLEKESHTFSIHEHISLADSMRRFGLLEEDVIEALSERVLKAEEPLNEHDKRQLSSIIGI